MITSNRLATGRLEVHRDRPKDPTHDDLEDDLPPTAQSGGVASRDLEQIVDEADGAAEHHEPEQDQAGDRRAGWDDLPAREGLFDEVADDVRGEGRTDEDQAAHGWRTPFYLMRFDINITNRLS